MEFSDIFESEYGLSPSIESEEDLRKILNCLRFDHLPKYRLWEFFVIHVESSVAELMSIVTSNVHYYPTPFPQNLSPEDIIIKTALSQESSQGRNSWRVSLNVVLSLFHSEIKAFRESKDEKILLELKRKYQKILNNINLERYKTLDQDMNTIFSNIESRVKYERLSDNGPKIGPISSEYVT